MKILKLSLTVCLTLSVFVFEVQARNYRASCKKVKGNLTETVIDPSGAPNDPLGRVVGISKGVLKGSTTAILLDLVPGPGGTLVANTVDVFVTADGMLVGTGQAVFTPISPTDVLDTLTLDIDPVASTGKFAGAYGSITLEGVGFNLLPGPTPGETHFIFDYEGEICYDDAWAEE